VNIVDCKVPLTLLFGWQEGHLACRKLSVGFLTGAMHLF